MKRLIVAFDVDGTLLDYRNVPRQEIIALLKIISLNHDVYVWSGGEFLMREA